MKSIIGASIMALLLVCLALPALVLTGSEGSTAAGSFKFAPEDGEIRFVEFKAEEQADGQAAGELLVGHGFRAERGCKDSDASE